MNPILLEVPVPIKTDRLLLRPVQAGDGLIVSRAVEESFEQFRQWMPWAKTKQTVQDSETRYAFSQLKAVRLQIKCDEDNKASRAIPEKLGFDLEGILKKDDVKMDGSLRNTAVYARFNADGLPALNVSW